MRESSSLRRFIIAAADIAPGDSVLLVGCGHVDTAELALEAAGPEGEVVVVDRDIAALRLLLDALRAEATEGRLELIQRDVGDGWGFHHLRFDHILCHNVMEYIHAPWKLMASMYQSLRPGGSLVLSQCDFTSIRFAAADKGRTAELVDCFCHRRQHWMGSTDASGTSLERHLHESAFGDCTTSDFTERDEEAGRVFAEALAFSAEQSLRVADEVVAAWKQQLYASADNGFAVDNHVFVAHR